MRRLASLILPAVLAAACSGTPSGQAKSKFLAPAVAKPINICHGYGCYYRSRLVLDARDGKRFAAIMAGGVGSPAAERQALRRAVSYFEERSYQVTGVRDEPKGVIGAGRRRGQMDCIDESTNTRSLLDYLDQRGMLRHHSLRPTISRGFLVDGRYPHFTAVIRDPAGTDWVVDSWFEPMGGPPDIMPVMKWKRAGVMGNRLPS